MREASKTSFPLCNYTFSLPLLHTLPLYLSDLGTFALDVTISTIQGLSIQPLMNQLIRRAVPKRKGEPVNNFFCSGLSACLPYLKPAGGALVAWLRGCLPGVSFYELGALSSLASLVDVLSRDLTQDVEMGVELAELSRQGQQPIQAASLPVVA